MWATLWHQAWNVLQCVCVCASTRSCLRFCDTTAGMWLCLVPECVPLCVSVTASCSSSSSTDNQPVTKPKHTKKAVLLVRLSLSLYFFFCPTCNMLGHAKINIPPVNVMEIKMRLLWMVEWVMQSSPGDTLCLWALSCQKPLLSLAALTHTSESRQWPRSIHYICMCVCVCKYIYIHRPKALLWAPGALFKSYNCRADSYS